MTFDDLIEINQKFNGGKMAWNFLSEIPNPSDVHPETYEQIKKMLHVKIPANQFEVIAAGFGGLEIHSVPDVEPGFLHRCTCRERHHGKDQISGPPVERQL